MTLTDAAQLLTEIEAADLETKPLHHWGDPETTPTLWAYRDGALHPVWSGSVDQTADLELVAAWIVALADSDGACFSAPVQVAFGFDGERFYATVVYAVGPDGLAVYGALIEPGGQVTTLEQPTVGRVALLLALAAVREDHAP